MSFKLNTELVNTTAVVEEASSQISDVATEAVSTIVQPIIIPQTVIDFTKSTNLDHSALVWFGPSKPYAEFNTNNTQIKGNCGFKIYLVKDSNITFTFYPGYATNFTITANGATVDGHQSQITAENDQWVELKSKNASAYITQVTINNRTASINEVLFNQVKPLNTAAIMSSCSTTKRLIVSDNNTAFPEDYIKMYVGANKLNQPDIQNYPYISIHAHTGDEDYYDGSFSLSSGSFNLSTHSHAGEDEYDGLRTINGRLELKHYSDDNDYGSSLELYSGNTSLAAWNDNGVAELKIDPNNSTQKFSRDGTNYDTIPLVSANGMDNCYTTWEYDHDDVDQRTLYIPDSPGLYLITAVTNHWGEWVEGIDISLLISIKSLTEDASSLNRATVYYDFENLYHITMEYGMCHYTNEEGEDFDGMAMIFITGGDGDGGIGDVHIKRLIKY